VTFAIQGAPAQARCSFTYVQSSRAVSPPTISSLTTTGCRPAPIAPSSRGHSVDAAQGAPHVAAALGPPTHRTVGGAASSQARTASASARRRDEEPTRLATPQGARRPGHPCRAENRTCSIRIRGRPPHAVRRCSQRGAPGPGAGSRRPMPAPRTGSTLRCIRLLRATERPGAGQQTTPDPIEPTPAVVGGGATAQPGARRAPGRCSGCSTRTGGSRSAGLTQALRNPGLARARNSPRAGIRARVGSLVRLAG
jgi:hypothetical protein